MGTNTWSLLTRYEPDYSVPLSGAEAKAFQPASDTVWFVFDRERLLGKLTCDMRQADETCLLPVGDVALPIGGSPVDWKLTTVSIHPMGRFDGHPCCLVHVEADDSPEAAESPMPGGMSWHSLRDVLPMMDDDAGFLAGRALQILHWERNNRFCGRCGRRMYPRRDERAMQCESCGFVQYPRLSPAVIVAVTRRDTLLLAHNIRFPAGRFSLLAGFVEPGETFEDCVAREIREEVGIRVGNIRYLSSQPWPFPDSLMVGFSAAWESGELAPDGVEIEEARWFGRTSLPDIPGPHTIAGKIIRQWLAHMV